MPELPEIQTSINDLLNSRIIGRRINDCRVLWPRSVRPLKAGDFQARISGLVLQQLHRRGKYMVFRLNRDQTLLVHLRMTGQFHLRPAGSPEDPHDRVIFELDDRRRLCFHDTRKFGRLILTADPEDILNRLGPEPFDPALGAEDFFRALRRRRSRIKALLLDQSFIAGLGNIYCDEALFAAGIHPLRNAASLREEEAQLLLVKIREVLNTGLRNRGTSLGLGETNYLSGGRRGENSGALHIYGKAGQRCPRCGSVIEKIYVAGRGSHLCPRCQEITLEGSLTSPG